MDDDSDTSSLSSVAPDEEVQKLAPIFLKAKKATKAVAPPPKATPPRPKRPPSPPHEEVLADNPDIAFIVMFRSRFSEAFPAKLAHYGPQDIERAVETMPSPQGEALLCALLGLVLNRKKPVEQGHHGRALEEAIQTHKSQWPMRWEGRNPLAGGRDFSTMTPEERLYLLRTLIMWSLSSSEDILAIVRNKYKQNRHNDDENQPLSVQPWGRDGDKRRYFLIEGQDDTSFRVYREGERNTKDIQWYSMAGEIEEIKALAEKLDKDDGSQAARTLSSRMLAAVPRFEATEEKRKRREYRQLRRAQFERPEPGFSLYEGRTRGKRARYTFDDDDAFLSDATSTRRSDRLSERFTPVDTGPMVTSSGRTVRPRRGGEYGASLLSGQLSADYDGTGERDIDGSEMSDVAPRTGRPMRTPRASLLNTNGKRKRVDDYDSIDDLSEDDAPPSGDDWDSEANEQEDHDMPDADDEDEGDMDIDDEELEGLDHAPRSLIVKFKIPTPGTNTLDEQHHRPDAAPSAPAFTTVTEQESIGVESEPCKSVATETPALREEPYDTPTQSTQSAIQQPLSGYPTPASLPAAGVKQEPMISVAASIPSIWKQQDTTTQVVLPVSFSQHP